MVPILCSLIFCMRIILDKRFGTFISFVSSSYSLFSCLSHQFFRRLLNPSPSPRYLHSAVITHGVMLIYGGNGHNATHDNAGDKCFSPQFMMYEIECDSWRILKDPAASLKYSTEIGRFGHTAAIYDNSMFVFGGFNGLMLNSLLKYTPGDCSLFNTKSDCLKLKPGVSCVWNEDKTGCQHFSVVKSFALSSTSINTSIGFYSPRDRCNQRVANFSELCQKQTTCPSCLENSYGCVWCSDSCHYEKCKKSGIKGFTDSNRCEDEALTSNCDKLHSKLTSRLFRSITLFQLARIRSFFN